MGFKMPKALWKRFLLGLGAFLLLLILVGFLLPARARVERVTSIHTTPDHIYGEIAALKRWPHWSAWTVARFPDMKTRFDGPDSGVGAVMIAEGKSSGDGTVTITRADPTKGVWYELDYEHGTQLFQGTILYEPSSEGLRVSWSLETDIGLNPIKRWAGLFLGNLMGSDMAQGLANLKAKIEAVK